VSDALKLFKEDDLLFKPGTKFGYSTYSYTLLQGVIEKISGKSFEKYLKSSIWDIAGMTNTSLENINSLVNNRAEGYSFQGSKIKKAIRDDLSYKYAGGGMLSSSEDLVKLGIALNKNFLISENLKNEMFIDQTNGFKVGYGWRIDEKDNEFGFKKVSHGGGSSGFVGILVHYPEVALTIAVLSNQDIYTKPSVSAALARIFMEDSKKNK